MALIYSTSKFGVDFTEAYIRVKKISFSVTTDSEGVKTRVGEAIVYIYPDKDTRLAEGEKLKVERVSITLTALDDNNSIKQVYDYLKTLPEYAGATDDMEVVQAAPPPPAE